MHQEISPFICHVFICTNDRHGKRKSCADGDAVEVRTALKKMIAEKGWKPKVRVSQAGCLGLCGKGPNVIIYPQQHLFSNVRLEDVDHIISVIAGELCD